MTPRLQSVRDDAAIRPESIVLGKDVLELVSSAMYVDALAVYREYVQNAADAIDAARQAGVLQSDEPGRIDVQIDPQDRRIRVRDNGTGIPAEHFAQRLTALGASAKRGTVARGFRGVGRLVGLGYAQELVFRSRTAEQHTVLELRWDCRRLKAALSDGFFKGDLTELVSQVVTVSELPGDQWPARFFEVELTRVIRQRSDKLMDAEGISDYLSQIAPIPFSQDFRFGDEIAAALRTGASLTELKICVNGGEPLVRPHRNEIVLGPGRTDSFGELSVLKIRGMDGDLAAVGWFLHHDYQGSLPVASLVKGLRLRSGNLQVGDHAILEGVFPEPRFNGWTVGEIHVLDPRIVPNGRRDHFQENAHFNNLINQLSPWVRDITRRCRSNSARRSKQRAFESLTGDVRERLGVLAQARLDATGRAKCAIGAEASLSRMEKLAAQDQVFGELAGEMNQTIANLRSELQQVTATPTPEAGPLAHLPPEDRAFYERMFSIVYDCASNRSAAQAMIDRIIEKIGRGRPLVDPMN